MDPLLGNLVVPAEADEGHDSQALSEGTPKPPDFAIPAVDDLNDSADENHEEAATIKEEDSDSEFLWKKMQEHEIDLANSSSDSDSEDEDAIPQIKQEPREYPVTFDDNGHRVLEVLDSDDEGWVHPIKQEPSASSGFEWKDLPNEPIVLSDAEDDLAALQSARQSSITPPIKQESGVEFLWAHNSNSGIIDLVDSDDENLHPGSNQPQQPPVLGHSLLRRSDARERELRRPDLNRLRELRQMYAARAIGATQGSQPGRVFSVPGPSSGRSDPHGVPDHDGNAWMRIAFQDTYDTAGNFAEIKRQYKAKKKAKTNTMQDDIAFVKARDDERKRLKILEAKTYQLNSSDDENEADQSDDGLFIPDGTPPPPFLDDHGNLGDNEAHLSTGHRSKKRKSNENPPSIKSEFRNELYHNLMAGYEEEAAKDQKKEEHKAMIADKAAKKNSSESKKKKNNPNSKHTHELKRGKRPGRKPDIKSKKISIRNLKTANIYKESNANLAKLAMPAMSGKEKKKAMTNLIASIPLEQAKLKQATSDKASILKATTILGNCKIHENRVEGEGDWNLKGLTTPLFHHQVQAAARMKEAECGEKPPQGGILADEMGHGKTLSAIAAMVSNRPAPSDPRQCTLIIASPAIISQWDDEIKKHTKTDVLGGIIRNHGISRISTKGASGRDAISLIERTGVVLSTYSEVVKSYPKCVIPDFIINPGQKMEWWKNEWDTERGILHRAQFFRVILDESQMIKNHRSYTSIACRALMAKHRWAISGTPIQNYIEEIYPYFKFLRIPFTGSFRIFKHNFCDPENEACTKRLHSYLDYMMIRRTHQDEILGTAIVKLPKAHQQTNELEFNEVEAKIYSKIRKRFIKIVNLAMSNKYRTEEDRRQVVLTMVLRLRQITSHLFMLHETMEAMFDVEDIDNFDSDLSEDSLNNSNCVNMLKALGMMIQAKDDDYETEKTADKTKKGKNESEQIFEFRKLLRNLKDNRQWGELREQSNCRRCKLPAEEPMLTSCSHLYCAECLKAMSYEASENDQDHSNCLKCNEAFTGSIPCPGLKELEPINISPPKPQNRQQGGTLDENLPERPHRSLADTLKWVTVNNDVVHSTKTAAVTAKIEEWLQEFPSQKIIVFSQFHLVFSIIGEACEKKNWKFCFYHGKMSHRAREDAVEKFRDDEEMKIMIASLKCGGMGLNLTMASRVICIDLWFNSSVEQQAFCRVLRIGQKLETHIARFVVKNTIDERLIQLQKYKDRIISAAMDDRAVLAGLSTKELLGLFGDVGLDADKQPFVYVEENKEKFWGPFKQKQATVDEVMDDEEPHVEEET